MARAAKTVTVIPPTINPLTRMPSASVNKRRVAGYARVSTDSDEQFTSYEAQIDYYTQYIKRHAEWEFVKVYTDSGISGTNTKHREGFNEMIADALAGKIDLIVTKSVSRFARNTVDSLVTVRKLKEKGVEVYFEKENIYTLDSKGELLITIMSSLAQEESRSLSENVTWGQRKRFSDGKVSLPYKHFLGYRKGANGLPEIVEEEAEIVRKIYSLYIMGKTSTAIARQLIEEGIPTPSGKQNWQSSTIESILTNEKYKGDALLQKSFTVDFLSKTKKTNEGEVPQYYVENSHPAIIPPEEWKMVQMEIARRKSFGRKYSCSNIFSTRLVCSDCGEFFGAKVWHSTDKQFLFNNIRIYNVVGTDGEINYDILCENFCYNFSTRLQRMALIFGEDKIKKFILDQLSAGKHTYNEDAFFQAFSEIEVLSFFHRGFGWKEIQYEPVTGKNGENPEAYFIGELKNKDSAEVLEVKANIEVKTPKFPDLNSRKDKILIPTVLLTPSGRTEILHLCNSYNVEYVPPRINKLVEFINSATKKFNYPKKNEYNLLYINWSYSDFPSNSFLEAWSLLTNKYNGLLTHPEIGTTLPIKEPVNPDAYKKITAIIVYSSSIEQLMFCDFSHVWQRAGAGCKFRMFVLDEKLREAELNNDSDLLFQITGMNPDPNATHTLLLSYTPTSPDDRIISEKFSNESLKLVLNNVLLNNE